MSFAIRVKLAVIAPVNDFIVHSIPLLARANCDVEEDPHVTLGHLSGSEKIEPILVSVLEQQGLRGRVVQQHSVHCLANSALDMAISVPG